MVEDVQKGTVPSVELGTTGLDGAREQLFLTMSVGFCDFLL